MESSAQETTRRGFVKTAGATTAMAALGVSDEAQAHTVEINALLPTPEQQKAFLELPDDRPVVMLNLLKFKPDGGRAQYMKYAAAVQPLLAKVGAKGLFGGTADFCMIGNADWDVVGLVQYPNKKALLEMTSSPEYQAIHHYREEGLEGQVLYAMTQLSGF